MTPEDLKRVLDKREKGWPGKAPKLSPEERAVMLEAIDAFEARESQVTLTLADWLDGVTRLGGATPWPPGTSELCGAALMAAQSRRKKPEMVDGRGQEAHTPRATISDQRARIHRGLWWEVRLGTIATAPALDDPDFAAWWTAEVDRRMRVEHGVRELPPEQWERRGTKAVEERGRKPRQAEPERAGEVIETRSELSARMNAALREPGANDAAPELPLAAGGGR